MARNWTSMCWPRWRRCVLPQAAELPVGRLRALVRAELVARDAEAADRRREQALAAADVFLRRSAHEGMAEVVTVLPQPEAAAMCDTVDRHARQAKADGDRAADRRAPRRGDGEPDAPPVGQQPAAVTAEVHVLAPLNSLVARSGRPHDQRDARQVSARSRVSRSLPRHLRALLTALDAVCPGGLQAPTGGSLHLDLLGAGGDLLATLSRPRARAGRSSRLPAPSRRRLPLRPRRQATADRQLPADRRPAAMGARPGISAAVIPAAATGSAGPTWITWSRTPTAGRPTATTCAACVAGTTG